MHISEILRVCREYARGGSRGGGVGFFVPLFTRRRWEWGYFVVEVYDAWRSVGLAGLFDRSLIKNEEVDKK